MTPAGTFRNERGAVFVLVGLLLFLLTALVGMATDYGVLVYTQNQGQAAVDTAALAGASGIPKYVDDADDSLIYERIAALDDANQVRGLSADLGGGGSTVDLLHYNLETNEFDCESGCDPEEVNAVRLTKTGYEAPVYFSWARNAFGSSEPATRTVNVSAVGYLGCPDDVDTGDGGVGPIALRECKIDFPEDCGVPKVLQSGGDNSAFTTFNLSGSSVCGQLVSGNPPSNLQETVAVGDVIKLVGTGQVTSCLMEVEERFDHCSASSCTSDPPDPTCLITLPVIDCGGSESNAIVVGFATACIRDVDSHANPKFIDAEVKCGRQIPGGPGGQCFGTQAQNPILIR